jgi:hypothetical protein
MLPRRATIDLLSTAASRGRGEMKEPIAIVVKRRRLPDNLNVAPHSQGQAAQFAAKLDVIVRRPVLPIIRDMQAAGYTRLNAIAGHLNARKVATANGGQWRHVQVRHILDRAPADEGRRPGDRRPATSRGGGARGVRGVG